MISKDKCKEEIKDDKVWLLNLDKIEKNTGKVIDYNYIEKEEAVGSVSRFDTGEILYSKLRPYLNKVVLTEKPGYATTELVRIKVDETKCNKYYLFRALLSDNFVTYISSKTTGAKMPRTNMNEFWKYQMPIPNIDLQNNFEKTYLKIESIEKVLFDEIEDLQQILKYKIEQYFI